MVKEEYEKQVKKLTKLMDETADTVEFLGASGEPLQCVKHRQILLHEDYIGKNVHIGNFNLYSLHGIVVTWDLPVCLKPEAQGNTCISVNHMYPCYN